MCNYVQIVSTHQAYHNTYKFQERGICLEKIVIRGGTKLCGEVEISGAKNSVVAILPATLLAQDVCRIENIPNISDVSSMLKILSGMGADVKYINKNTVDASFINKFNSLGLLLLNPGPVLRYSNIELKKKL